MPVPSAGLVSRTTLTSTMFFSVIATVCGCYILRQSSPTYCYVMLLQSSILAKALTLSLIS